MGRQATRGDGWVYVGSGGGVQIRLDDAGISGVHARLRRDPPGFVLEDLGSTNGTFLSGQRLEPHRPVTVPADAQVVLGRTPLPLAHPRLAAGTGQPAEFPRPMILGADPSCDLVFEHPAVSSHHAEVLSTPQGLMLLDGVGLPAGGRAPSRNGTWVDDTHVHNAVPLHPESVIRLAVFQVPQRIVRSWWSDAPIGAPAALPARAAASLPPQGEVSIGREAGNDVVIPGATVSRNHAKLSVVGGVWYIEDLGSANGTFVDGVRIQGRVRIGLGAHVVIGEVPLDLSEGQVVANAAAANRGIRLRADAVRFDVPNFRRGVSEPDSLRGRFKIRSREILGGLGLYRPRQKTLIEPMTVALGPGEVIAVMGASGAGKSTLLKMLNGYRATSDGTVLADGVALRENLGHFAHRIGYVPQDDVMHRALTVGEVLEFTGRLRMPGDSREQIRTRVKEILSDLNLVKQRNVKVGDALIRGISGGQRRRLNMAMELLRKPELLILDEPTSGLDSSSTEEVLDICKRLADDGCTVVMTIHQPGEGAIRRIDNLLLLGKDAGGERGGELIYLGRFDRVRAYFSEQQAAVDPRVYPNDADFALEVASKHHDIAELARTYEGSPQRGDYFELRTEEQQAAAANKRSGKLRSVPFARQLGAFVERSWRGKVADWRSLLVQLAQPVILVVLMMLLFDDVTAGVESPVAGGRFDPMAMQQALFMLSAGALWLGCSNAAREIVSERAIFLRELHWGISPSAYLASKLGVQSALVAAQMGILALAGPLVGLPGGWAAWPLLFGTLLIGALVGTGQGLILSAGSRSELMAVSLVPLTLLPQLLLSGFLPFFQHMPERLQTVSAAVPLRWIFESAVRSQASGLDAAQEVQDAFVSSIYGADGGAAELVDWLSLGGASPTALAVAMLVLLGTSLVGWTAWRLARFKKVEHV